MENDGVAPAFLIRVWYDLLLQPSPTTKKKATADPRTHEQVPGEHGIAAQRRGANLVWVETRDSGEFISLNPELSTYSAR